jgi:hypothetical protein
MGYYTDYNLEVETSMNSRDIIIDLINTNENAQYAFDEDGYCIDSMKWYNAEEEIKEFSLKYPNVLFKLRGKGESDDDMWLAFIQNGKSYRKDLILLDPKFDSNLLV